MNQGAGGGPCLAVAPGEPIGPTRLVSPGGPAFPLDLPFSPGNPERQRGPSLPSLTNY